MAELEDLDAITANLYSEPGSPDQVDVNPAGDIKYLIATGVIDRTDVVVAVTVGETGAAVVSRLRDEYKKKLDQMSDEEKKTALALGDLSLSKGFPAPDALAMYINGKNVPQIAISRNVPLGFFTRGEYSGWRTPPPPVPSMFPCSHAPTRARPASTLPARTAPAPL